MEDRWRRLTLIEPKWEGDERVDTRHRYRLIGDRDSLTFLYGDTRTNVSLFFFLLFHLGQWVNCPRGVKEREREKREIRDREERETILAQEDNTGRMGNRLGGKSELLNRSYV